MNADPVYKLFFCEVNLVARPTEASETRIVIPAMLCLYVNIVLVDGRADIAKSMGFVCDASLTQGKGQTDGYWNAK